MPKTVSKSKAKDELVLGQAKAKKPAPKPKTETTTGTAPMKGGSSFVLTFGLVSIPVKVHTAAREIKVEFNLLHREDLTKLKRIGSYCPACHEDIDDQKVSDVLVAEEDIVHGYEFAKGQFVTVEDEEIEEQRPESSKVLEILEFVPADQPHPIHFESSFYLAPDTTAGQRMIHNYGVVRDALSRANMVAVSKMVKGKREHIVIIMPYGDNGLVGYTAFMSDEIKPCVFPELPAHTDAEVEAATRLIKALTAEWDPSKYRDEYRERIMAVIQAKIEGTEVEKPKPRKAVEAPSDFLAAMEQSIADAKKKRRVA